MKKMVALFFAVAMMTTICIEAEEEIVYENEVITTTERENLALGKDVILFSDEQKENPAQNLTDGDLTTYWGAYKSGHYVIIDLEDVYYISGIEFKPEKSRAYGYKIEGSIDGVAFTEIVTMENNTSAEMLSCEFAPAQTRYVRFTITELPAGVDWVNIKEIFIYGDNSGSDLLYSEEPLSIEANSEVVIGTLKTGVTVLNGKAITLIVAIYDGNRMLAYKAETHLLPYTPEVERSIEITSDDVGVALDGKRIEMFVWDDLDNMKTIVSPAVVTIGATE